MPVWAELAPFALLGLVGSIHCAGMCGGFAVAAALAPGARARAVLGSLGELVRFGLPDDYWSTYADRVRALQLDDVVRVSQTLINTDQLAWVVVGDRAKIEAGLKELGFEQIIEVDADGMAVPDRVAAD